MPSVSSFMNASTYDVATGIGGLNGSIQYELAFNPFIVLVCF